MKRKIKNLIPEECIEGLLESLEEKGWIAKIWLDTEIPEPKGVTPVGVVDVGRQKDCGFCGSMLYTMNDPLFMQVGRSYKYCPHCGAKIDWEGR